MEYTLDIRLPEHLSLRQKELLRLVAEKGFAPVETLAQRLGVSTQTIRRDIGVLCEAKLLQRFHGGAGIADTAVRLGYAKKRTRNKEGKTRIAEAVAQAIPDKASIFLDVGTTVEAVAHALLPRDGLRVFTHSMAAASVFNGHPTSEVFVTGGMLRGADGSLVGETALAGVSRFKAEFGVVALSGFEEDGTLMDFDLEKVAIKQAIMSNSRTVFLVADASKFERIATVRVGSPSLVDSLFTDAPPPPFLADVFEQAGVRVVVADQ